MKIFGPIRHLWWSAMLLPALAGAHPGHSPEGTVAHAAEHAWAIGGIVLLVAIAAAVLIRQARNRSDR